jgi:hypothetical protein
VDVSVEAGSNIITVNGKKYVLPAGVNLSTDNPPSVEVKGTDVYINGVKLNPEK